MKVSVLGYGTVGRGVCEMVEKSSFLQLESVLVRKGKLNVVSCAVDSIDLICSDKETDVVVECMGGIEPAFEYAIKCMQSGKSFVTANKALVAAKGIELRDVAMRNGVSLLFSAACGGAIPVLHNVQIAKQTDRILSCGGIINGTTNFILSSLEEGRFSSYKDALSEVQKLGYAEADPTADVSGLDTLRKIILLSAVAFDKLVSDGVLNEGIENIDLCPLQFRSGDMSVKLIGKTGLNKDGSVYAYVEPVIFEKDSPFASVGSNFNEIFYNGRNCGLISLYGQGAGRYPTASAVLRDLSEIASSKGQTVSMLSSACVSGCADNTQEKHSYVYADNNGVRIINEMSVQSMHSMAKENRKAGVNCFFASLDESAVDNLLKNENLNEDK